MAYGNYLASVPADQVQAYRSGERMDLSPTQVVLCSHMIAYSIRAQPLGEQIGKVLDGGTPLAEKLWHPFRAPTYHRPAEVASLFLTITETWTRLLEFDKAPADGDWYRDEIERVLDILRHATTREEGLVSVLEPPMDSERASKVIVPFPTPDE